jgi:ABC-type multidrug transport system ATPase subunit
VPERRERCGAMLERFGLWRERNERAGDFSRGMLQRLALSRAFLHDPDLLLFDEPFDGLDAEGAELLQQELAERSRCTALVSTHDPELLASRATGRIALA